MNVEGRIDVNRLSKRYGSFQAVHDVGFVCERGSITAFLGPNGSGKSTTLRMMTGLTLPDAGTCTFGGSPMSELQTAGRTVGVLLEAAAHHNGRSVIETVTLAAMLTGAGRDRARECLDLVGLGPVERKRVGSLSLGMRQRMGLAIALVGTPRFLVLDEPANGLDPEGISWMAGLLSDFTRHGGTVLLSSHHLDDVEAIADHVVILDKGRVVQDYVASAEHRPMTTIFATTDDDLFLSRLSALGVECHRDGSHRFATTASPEQISGHSIEWTIPLVHLALQPARAGDLRETFLTSTTGEFTGGRLAEILEKADS